MRSVVWSADDSKIVSCGMDGAVYEWETATGMSGLLNVGNVLDLHDMI